MSNKIFFSVEYDFQSSPQLLFQYISTPSGLSEWFADNVNSRGELFQFIWDDSEEQAKLIQSKSNEKVRFQWDNGEEDDKDYYFEFKIEVDEITKDVSLVVSDFADEDEIEESKLLWDNLIADLKQVLGSA
ncbi:MAG: START-like domain-containing protein [Bacteroidetes bacterium]|nr:START-like domain-containing protein [Bacteroidota bacterium]MDA0936713.1 START-like domain-containing protein [Bacteroidota bacterium]